MSMNDLKLLDEKQALAAIDRSKVRQALRRAFEGLATGATVQPKQTLTLFPKDEGDCIFYPGVVYDLDLVGVKISPYINALKRDGKYPVTAYTLLLSASTGRPLLLCDSYALTTARTAGTTALALEYLIQPEAKNLAVIGSGKVAIEHLMYVNEQHSWDQIEVWSPSLDKDAEKAKRISKQLRKINEVAAIGESAENVVRKADVVMLCTSSGTPVIEYGWLRKNAVVTSISTNAAQAHEIDPASLANFQVFCDYKETAPETAGEMILAQEKGLWDKSSLAGDLTDLILGKSKRDAGKMAYFRSTGLGLEDLALASLLV